MKEKLIRPSCYEPPLRDELRRAIEAVVSEEVVSDDSIRLTSGRIKAHLTEAIRQMFDDARLQAIVTDVSDALEAEIRTPINLIRAARANENELVAWFASESMNRAWQAGLFFANLQGDWQGVVMEELDFCVFRLATRLGLTPAIDADDAD